MAAPITPPCVPSEVRRWTVVQAAGSSESRCEAEVGRRHQNPTRCAVAKDPRGICEYGFRDYANDFGARVSRGGRCQTPLPTSDRGGFAARGKRIAHQRADRVHVWQSEILRTVGGSFWSLDDISEPNPQRPAKLTSSSGWNDWSRGMNLKNRLSKLERTKRKVTAKADCICFPPEELPDQIGRAHV